MLKVLYLPLNIDDKSIQHGTYDAWENVGVDLKICDFYQVWLHNGKNKKNVEQDFLDKVREFRPNLIHMQLQFTGLIEPQTLLEARKICPDVIITNWTGDCRATAISEFIKIANVVDYPLISSTGQLELYKNAGCSNMRYWQIGYDPKFNYPMNKSEFQYDGVFIGNNYGSTFPDGQLRASAVNFLQNNIPRFGVFGNGYTKNIKSVDYRQSNEVYNKSICAISISNFNNVSHYFSDRLLHCLASGRPTISWYFPGIESYFVEGSEILVARNNMEISEHIKYCKNNLEAANQIGINGYKRVLREHTFTSKILELIDIVGLSHLL